MPLHFTCTNQMEYVRYDSILDLISHIDDERVRKMSHLLDIERHILSYIGHPYHNTNISRTFLCLSILYAIDPLSRWEIMVDGDLYIHRHGTIIYDRIRPILSSSIGDIEIYIQKYYTRYTDVVIPDLLSHISPKLPYLRQSVSAILDEDSNIIDIVSTLNLNMMTKKYISISAFVYRLIPLCKKIAYSYDTT